MRNNSWLRTPGQMVNLIEYVKQQDPSSSFVMQIGANTHEAASQRGDPYDNAVKLAIARGWKALLVEPAPQSFGLLRSRYAHLTPRVQTKMAAVCAGSSKTSNGCNQIAQRFYSLDVSNGTGTHGSEDADVRCTLGQFGSKSIWISQLASFNRQFVFRHSGSFMHTPAECRRCTKRLGRTTPLPDNCLRNVLKRNLVQVPVSCLCLKETAMPGSTLRLLIIDAEGNDEAVLHQFPFERLRPARVIFESTHLHRSWLKCGAAAEKRGANPPCVCPAAASQRSSAPSCLYPHRKRGQIVEALKRLQGFGYACLRGRNNQCVLEPPQPAASGVGARTTNINL